MEKYRPISVSKEVLERIKSDPKLEGLSYDSALREILGMEPKPGAKGTSKYPIRTLAVGESVTMQWVKDDPDQRRINQAVDCEARRTGKRFLKQGFGSGLKVTRLA